MSPQILCRVTYGNPRPPAAITAHMTVRPALLPGFKRHRVKYVDYPAIVPHPEATAEEDGVRGTVVTGLTDVMVMKLDHFEGDMYERRHVEVLVLDGEGKGERVRVETYVWQKARSGLEEKEWDFDEFMREKASYWIDVEREDYVGESRFAGLDVLKLFRSQRNCAAYQVRF